MPRTTRSARPEPALTDRGRRRISDIDQRQRKSRWGAGGISPEEVRACRLQRLRCLRPAVRDAGRGTSFQSGYCGGAPRSGVGHTAPVCSTGAVAASCAAAVATRKLTSRSERLNCGRLGRPDRPRADSSLFRETAPTVGLSTAPGHQRGCPGTAASPRPEARRSRSARARRRAA